MCKKRDQASLFPDYTSARAKAALSKSFLINQITHVLSIGASPAKHVKGISVIASMLGAKDSATFSIFKVADIACDIIDNAYVVKGDTAGILVHYNLGVSRSPVIVATYLMTRTKMTLKYMEMDLFGKNTLDVEMLFQGAFGDGLV